NDVEVDLRAVAAVVGVGIGVGDAGRAFGNEAPAIDQGQGALRTQTVQIDEILRNTEAGLRVGGTRGRHTECRQFVQGRTDIQITALIEGFRIDAGGRLE